MDRVRTAVSRGGDRFPLCLVTPLCLRRLLRAGDLAQYEEFSEQGSLPYGNAFPDMGFVFLELRGRLPLGHAAVAAWSLPPYV